MKYDSLLVTLNDLKGYYIPSTAYWDQRTMFNHDRSRILTQKYLICNIYI